MDRSGNIYVAEIGSKHRVQKLGPDGTFVAEWAPGFIRTETDRYRAR